MLETKFDFLCPAKIQDEREDVDVDESASKYGYLVGGVREHGEGAIREGVMCEGVMCEGVMCEGVMCEGVMCDV